MASPDIPVTIGIKALNEEKKIAACLASALEAARAVGGEVVLADSGSADRTVEIAQGFPVRIVRFADVSERCCGAAAQLAFQHARGRYFYLLDGDMTLNRAFLPQALAHLEARPGLAGVGGLLRENNAENVEFAMLAERLESAPDWRPGPVAKLEGGGLYRVEALREAGYFADRNLRAFEEFDLAARLRARGWGLERIAVPAVEHFGHQMPTWRLLWRRYRSGYAGSAGEVLRAALGQPHWRQALALGHIRNAMVVYGWWMALLASMLAGAPLWLSAGLLLAPFALLLARTRSPARTLYVFAVWNLVALGSLSGFFRRRRPPRAPIVSVDLSPSPAAAPATTGG